MLWKRQQEWRAPEELRRRVGEHRPLSVLPQFVHMSCEYLRTGAGVELTGECHFGEGRQFWDVLPPYCLDLAGWGLPFRQCPECM